MNAHDVLNALDVADEELLGEVEHLRATPRKKKASPYIWFAAAACLCLLCCGGWLLAKQKDTTPSQPDIQIMVPSTHRDETTSEPSTTHIPTESASVSPTEEIILLDPSYIGGNGIMEEDASRQLCIFSHELTEENLPFGALPKGPEWMRLSAYTLPSFLEENTQSTIYITVTTSLPGNLVDVTIGEQRSLSPYRLPDEPEYFYWNGVTFALAWYPTVDKNLQPTEMLYAEARVNDCFCIFSLRTSEDTRSQNEADFIQVLQSFAESSIHFDALCAAIFPEPTVGLSHEAILKTEPYGKYFLTQIPEGFTEETMELQYLIHSDTFPPLASSLFGTWTRGYDELFWRVSAFAEEDTHRLTHAGETERYDMSLYPIPRADSVPEELREVVDNPIFYAEELSPELIWARAYKSGEQGDSNGWRMSFSVLYGDTVVTVRSKGVDPDWLYTQLLSIRKDS